MPSYDVFTPVNSDATAIYGMPRHATRVMTKHMDQELVERALARLEYITSKKGKADALGVSPQTMKRWLDGEVAVPLQEPTRQALRVFLGTATNRPGKMSAAEGAFWQIAAIVDRVRSGDGDGPDSLGVVEVDRP